MEIQPQNPEFRINPEKISPMFLHNFVFWGESKKSWLKVGK